METAVGPECSRYLKCSKYLMENAENPDCSRYLRYQTDLWQYLKCSTVKRVESRDLGFVTFPQRVAELGGYSCLVLYSGQLP